MKNRKCQFEMGYDAFTAVLDEFRQGHIENNWNNTKRLKKHMNGLFKEWDQQFPGFPKIPFSYSSFIEVCLTSLRDRHLKKIITGLLRDERSCRQNKIIVNPACVFGRHARDLASCMGSFKVIGTDINPRFNWFYERFTIGKSPSNYEFKQDDIFNPQLQEKPIAVVFFGACGSVSDGAIDYGVESKAMYLIFRTCCHDNIGGNTEITKRFTILNWDFRVKNFVYAQKRERKTGEYFCDKYSKDHYPRSKAARAVSNSDEFMDISRNSVDSDICRTIIDLDRYLYLLEKEYMVWFKGDLFVAQRNTKTV